MRSPETSTSVYAPSYQTLHRPSAVRRYFAAAGPLPDPVAMRASSQEARRRTWPSRYRTIDPSASVRGAPASGSSGTFAASPPAVAQAASASDATITHQ